MAYEKQNFSDGQVLKAEHLNHMEKGIESAIHFNNQQTITWDGVIQDGDVFFDIGIDELGTTTRLVKVSDEIPQKTAVLGGVLWVKLSQGSFHAQIKEPHIKSIEFGEGFAVIVGNAENQVVVLTSPSSEMSAQGITPGVYFSVFVTSTVTKLRFGASNIQDAKTIPAGYGRLKDSIEILTEMTISDNESILLDPIPLSLYKTYRIEYNGVRYYDIARPAVIDGVEVGVGLGLNKDIGNAVYDDIKMPFYVVSLYPDFADMLGAGLMVGESSGAFLEPGTISVWEDIYEPVTPDKNSPLTVMLYNLRPDSGATTGTYLANASITNEEFSQAIRDFRFVTVNVRAMYAGENTASLVVLHHTATSDSHVAFTNFLSDMFFVTATFTKLSSEWKVSFGASVSPVNVVEPSE